MLVLHTIQVALSNLTVPYYHLLGNHDLDNLDFSEWIWMTHLKIRSSNALRESENSDPESKFRFSFSPTLNLRFLCLNSFAFGVVGHKRDDTESRVSLDQYRPSAAIGDGDDDARWTKPSAPHSLFALSSHSLFALRRYRARGNLT